MIIQIDFYKICRRRIRTRKKDQKSRLDLKIKKSSISCEVIKRLITQSFPKLLARLAKLNMVGVAKSTSSSIQCPLFYILGLAFLTQKGISIAQFSLFSVCVCTCFSKKHVMMCNHRDSIAFINMCK